MGYWLRHRPAREPLGDWRRAAFLVMFGLLHGIYGFALLILPLTDSQRDALTVLLSAGVPVAVAGWVWIASGLLASMFAFVPPGSDGWGFRALVAVEFAWVSLYLWGWIFGENERGWAQAATFAGLAVAVALVSGMVSASRVAVEARRLIEAMTTGGT